MTRSTAKPSLWRILQSDYLAMLAVLAPLAFLIMYLAIAIFGFLPDLRGHDPIRADGAPFFFWGLVITALVGLPFAFWRVKKVRDVFTHGFEVEGHVLEVKFFRDRGSVAYTYNLDGHKIIGWNAIMANKRTQQLMPGLPVTLVVDSANHKKAYVRDLYV